MNANVIVYISPGCPDCAAVKRYLANRGVPFEERDITAPAWQMKPSHAMGFG